MFTPRRIPAAQASRTGAAAAMRRAGALLLVLALAARAGAAGAGGLGGAPLGPRWGRARWYTRTAHYAPPLRVAPMSVPPPLRPARRPQAPSPAAAMAPAM
jgi:hypothetical protein